MKTLLMYALLFLTIIFPVLCFEESNINATVLLDYSWKLSEASNKFGFNLLSKLINQNSKNVIFSPISVFTTFGLIYLGTKGTTSKELETALGYRSVNLTRKEVFISFQHLLTDNLITVEPRAYVLDLATALFVNKNLGLRVSYKSEADKYFKSPVEAVKFSDGGIEAVRRVNEFVKNKTRGKICSIIDYLDASVDLIAVNALYFKSRWTIPFLESSTRSGMFYNAGKTAVFVPMMIKEDYYMYFEDENISLVNLGFWGRNMSMIIILPHQLDGLAAVEDILTHQKLTHYLLNSYPKALKLTLPKFNLTYVNELSSSLHSMGVQEVFQYNKANLTGMVEQETVSVGSVRHKAVIEVNENGIEASGVTAVLSFKSMPLPGDFPDSFTVDHPFLFFILDERTDLIILMGRVFKL